MTQSDNVAELLHQILKLHMAVHHLNEAMGNVETAKLLLNSLAILDARQIMDLESVQAELAQWVHIFSSATISIDDSFPAACPRTACAELGLRSTKAKAVFGSAVYRLQDLSLRFWALGG